MRTKLITLVLVLSVLLGACAQATPQAQVTQAPPVKETVIVPQTQIVEQPRLWKNRLSSPPPLAPIRKR